MADRSAAMNLKQGVGDGSRTPAAATSGNLPQGWRFERRSDKYCVWFDEAGKRYKSSSEVEVELKKRGMLLESDVETGEESLSEYEPSPVKKFRTSEQASTSRFVVILVNMQV